MKLSHTYRYQLVLVALTTMTVVSLPMVAMDNDNEQYDSVASVERKRDYIAFGNQQSGVSTDGLFPIKSLEPIDPSWARKPRENRPTNIPGWVAWATAGRVTYFEYTPEQLAIQRQEAQAQEERYTIELTATQPK